MCPYWGVTRCSNAEMRKLQAQEATTTLRFNLGITPVSFANIIVAGEGATNYDVSGDGASLDQYGCTGRR